jgi:hypothetical protein
VYYLKEKTTILKRNKIMLLVAVFITIGVAAAIAGLVLVLKNRDVFFYR